MTSASSPPPVSYVAQVLLEEAERRATQDRGNFEGTSAAAAVTAHVATLNLKDEQSFPTLGNATGGARKQPTWMASGSASVVAPKPVASSTSMSQAFQLPFDHQRGTRPDDGSLGELCAKVMKTTGTTVEASVSTKTRAISFVIRGSEGNIMAAKRMLWSHLAQSGSIEVEVPEETIRFIIGPGGSTLRGIESATATKLHVSKTEEQTGCITISGDFEGVAQARDMILKIVALRTNMPTRHIEVERLLVPFLWMERVSGVSLAGLSAKHPALRITQNKTADGVTVAISGDCARELVDEVADGLEGAVVTLRDSIKSVSAHIPKGLHRFLVGSKATVLRQIEETTGCHLVVPPVDADSDQVVIYGTQENLLQGLAAVLNQTRGMESRTIVVSPIAARLIQQQAKRRSAIRAIEREHGVTISASATTLELVGDKEKVLAATQEVEKLLAALSGLVAVEQLAVDEEYLKHVVGRGGQTLQQLQADFDVEMFIDQDDNVVFVGSDAARVSAAKAHVVALLASIVEMLTTTAKIDAKYHGQLIGAKGANLASYQQKYPSVLIIFASDLDTVTFKGSRTEVEQCRAELIAQAEAIRHETIMSSYTQAIELDEKDAPRIGKARGFLSTFARQHAVKLLFDDQHPLQVTVQGVKRAVDAALPLVKEQIALVVDRDSLVFSVDSAHHGLLIGAEGRNVKRLAQKYSVKIVFPHRKRVEDGSGDEDGESTVGSPDATSEDAIKIVGPRTTISKARDELLDLLAYHLAHSHRDTMLVPQSAVSQILGRNGTVIESIRLETDCTVEIDLSSKSKQDSITVKLQGTETGVAEARKRIETIVREVKEQTEIVVEAPSKERLNELTSVFKREFRNFTNLFRGDEHKLHILTKSTEVALKGRAASVYAARVALQALFADIESGELMAAEVNIPPNTLGRLFGVGGATIKRLTTDFEVDIQTPRMGESSPVSVTGHKKNVLAACEEIRSICQEERVFKFSSPRVKNEVMALVKDQIAALQVEWKDHPAGVALKGNAADCDRVWALLTKEVANCK